jgi:glutamate-1-semialdehyde 2,1-aminomutase
MESIGTKLRDGIERQALAAGVTVFQTGPAQMPNLRFADDRRFAKARVFCGSVVDHGVIVHPRHNWFVSAAHTDHDVERVLEATWEGFQAVLRQFGAS